MRRKIKYQPIEFASRALHIDYGFHSSPFGLCLIMIAQGSVLGLAFVKKDKHAAFQDMAARWPCASYREAPEKTIIFVKKVFKNGIMPAEDSLEAAPLLLIGTDFQREVWKKLLGIPAGRVMNYGSLAESLGRPKAARAVARAVGQNPISWLVPCHRIVRRDGGLGGYHWGIDFKKKMLEFEKKQKISNYKKAA